MSLYNTVTSHQEPFHTCPNTLYSLTSLWQHAVWLQEASIYILLIIYLWIIRLQLFSTRAPSCMLLTVNWFIGLMYNYVLYTCCAVITRIVFVLYLQDRAFCYVCRKGDFSRAKQLLSHDVNINHYCDEMVSLSLVHSMTLVLQASQASRVSQENIFSLVKFITLDNLIGWMLVNAGDRCNTCNKTSVYFIWRLRCYTGAMQCHCEPC